MNPSTGGLVGRYRSSPVVIGARSSAGTILTVNWEIYFRIYFRWLKAADDICNITLHLKLIWALAYNISRFYTYSTNIKKVINQLYALPRHQTLLQNVVCQQIYSWFSFVEVTWDQFHPYTSRLHHCHWHDHASAKEVTLVDVSKSYKKYNSTTTKQGPPNSVIISQDWFDILAI